MVTASPAVLPKPSRLRFGTLSILLFTVFAAPFVETRGLPASFRAGLLGILTAGLFLLLAGLAVRRDTAQAWKPAPCVWAVGVLLWALVPWRVGPFRAFADAELLRVALGVAVCLAACALPPAQAGLAARLLVMYGVCVAACALGQFGSAQTVGSSTVFDHMLGPFGQFENLGSFLMLLLPFGSVLAFNRIDTEPVRLGWQGAWLLLLITLLLSCVRAAWVMSLISLGLTWGLCRRFLPPSPEVSVRGARWNTIVPLALALLAALVIGHIGGVIFRRSATLSHIARLDAFTDRVFRTRQACRVAAEEPVTGWGLGAWTVRQQAWTGEGDDARAVFQRRDVWSRGMDDQSTAFDYWAQWFAVSGVPGLVLLAGFTLSSLSWALRALPGVTHPRRRTVVIACLAGMVGFVGDGFCSPAYDLPGDYVLPWLFAGLAVTACRGSLAATAPRRSSGFAAHALPLIGGLVFALTLFIIGLHARPTGASPVHSVSLSQP